MFQASYSTESRVRGKLNLWEMSVETFTTLALLNGVSGVGRTKLSDALRGRSSLPHDAAVRMDELLKELENFIRAFEPLHLDLSNSQLLFEWLLLFREGKIRLVRRQNEANPNDQ